MATWSLRLRPVCSRAPTLAGELGDPPLDRGVDVLVAGLEHQGAGGELLGHPVEGGQQDAARLGSDRIPARGQPAYVGPRPRQVVGGQPRS